MLLVPIRVRVRVRVRVRQQSKILTLANSIIHPALKRNLNLKFSLNFSLTLIPTLALPLGARVDIYPQPNPNPNPDSNPSPKLNLNLNPSWMSEPISTSMMLPLSKSSTRSLEPSENRNATQVSRVRMVDSN